MWSRAAAAEAIFAEDGDPGATKDLGGPQNGIHGRAGHATGKAPGKEHAQGDKNRTASGQKHQWVSKRGPAVHTSNRKGEGGRQGGWSWYGFEKSAAGGRRQVR